VVVGDVAYISLYSPELDPSRVDASGNPADVIAMDVTTGAILHSFSFFDSLNDDGARTARADKMERVGDKLYVCIQDLDGAFFDQNAAGKIGVIDLATNTIERVFTLQGR